MRRFFEAFPEVLMIDATHNTNASRYKLFSFMIHDVFGHGQYVQHALMENESNECMTDAVTSFKSFNPTWDRVRVIIVDKDFGEIGLLQEQFPGARILLCIFHVMKYLRGEMSKRDYGILDREKVEDAVHMMLNAQTEDEYETGRRYLYYIVDGIRITSKEDVPEPKHPFLLYFHANWHQCRLMWSGYGRSDVPHLGNTTNNRLEALRQLNEYVQELTSSANSTRVYHLDTREYRCSCAFMRTELLPCRHVIYWSLISGKNPIPLKHIHPRLCMTYPLNIPVAEDTSKDDAARNTFRVKNSSLTASSHKVLNGTNKFRTAYDVGCRIADIMSRNGTPIYLKMLKALRGFEDVVKNDEVPLVTRIQATGEAVLLPKMSTLQANAVSSMNSSDSDIPPTLLTGTRVPARVTKIAIQAADQSHTANVPDATSHTASVPDATSHTARHTGGLPDAMSHTASVPGGVTSGKKRTERDGERSSYSSDEALFFVSKSTKSRGRPVIRKTQAREEKKRRMGESKSEAKQLVQGMLMPIPTLSNVARVLESSYSYESANEFLSSFPVKSVGPRKQAIPKMLVSNECISGVKFVFAEKFVKKCCRALEEFQNRSKMPTLQ